MLLSINEYYPDSENKFCTVEIRTTTTNPYVSLESIVEKHYFKATILEREGLIFESFHSS